MTPLIITISVIVLAIMLLTFTRLRPDLIALMAMLILGLTSVVDQNQIFSGFSSSAVMTILGISMISVALHQTGAANAIGNLLYRLGSKNEVLLILLVSLASAILSLFMNNIAAVGVLLPAVMTLSRRSHTPPSRLLMPLAFGTILGGMATLLTTSNIIVSSALKEAGYSTFGLLDYFPVGAPVALIGIIYLITLGRNLLPKNVSSAHPLPAQDFSEKIFEHYKLDEYVSCVRILPGSSLIGKSVSSGIWAEMINLNVLSIIRNNRSVTTPLSSTLLRSGDAIIIQGTLDPSQLESFNLDPVDPKNQDKFLGSKEFPFAEVLLSPHSRHIGKDLCEIDFRTQYGLNVLGIWLRGQAILSNFSHQKLEIGDALLVQGSGEQIRHLKQDQDFILLEEDPDSILNPRKMWLTLGITVLTLTIASIGYFPVAQVILAGAVLLILTKCMRISDAIQNIEWRVIFLIAGLWPLTIAIRETGVASSISDFLLASMGDVPPLAIAGIFLFIAMLFTQFLSGPVAPIVIIPLALSTAETMGIDPHPLAMAVALGCSLAFITPLGHPVNLMVMNPGGYTFKDYFRVGLPLTILSFIVILTGIHFIWGL